MHELILGTINIPIAAKDRHSRFLYCNEAFAKIAGLDSPSAAVGKTDRDLVWSKNVDSYLNGDGRALRGEVLINVLEKQFRGADEVDIVINKRAFFYHCGNKIGVIVSVVDLDHYLGLNNLLCVNVHHGKSYFKINGIIECFTKMEYQVLRYLILSQPARLIAIKLNISRRTVEDYINKIKNKLQCNKKHEIVEAAIQYGVVHIFGLDEKF